MCEAFISLVNGSLLPQSFRSNSFEYLTEADTGEAKYSKTQRFSLQLFLLLSMLDVQLMLKGTNLSFSRKLETAWLQKLEILCECILLRMSL